ncbi:ABC transporter substrate-binding protein [Pseudoflavitalea sp. X16]|uniref:heme/hemin ABC transporter substrate-binding protein n=1 Tax=Paraflavitalea devenefica TaxID=2716334 RepID=UPI0014223A78|nr:ABC transporter substrate-binding protein [Paraflavitalea devenefica]NII25938.1 ABC transporter substrate-binding protein [Paraflavitalea devenefica]
MIRFIFITLLVLRSMSLLATDAPQRIITLSGALTEVADALGFGKNIVAVDVTSEFPAYVKQLPKVSRNRSLSVEGLMAYRPDIVLAPEGDISKAIQSQLKAAGITLVNIKQEYSVKGALQFIRTVAAALQVPEKGQSLALQTEKEVNAELEKIRQAKRKTPGVLFIYARGAGAMSVAGKGSNMDALIQLAGGKNVVQEFSDFKPYSTEAMIRANPDAILLFDFGLSSLGGKNALLKMPGITTTKAGKNKCVIEMDGPLLVNFSVRLATAIRELNRQLVQITPQP